MSPIVIGTAEITGDPKPSVEVAVHGSVPAADVQRRIEMGELITAKNLNSVQALLRPSHHRQQCENYRYGEHRVFAHNLSFVCFVKRVFNPSYGVAKNRAVDI